MNAALDWNLWRPFFTTLAVGTTIIFVAALLMQRWTRSMAWRRTIWQVAFLSLGLLAITEISGAGRAAWSWLQHRAQSESGGQLLVESRVIGEPDLRMLLAQRSQNMNTPAPRVVRGSSPTLEPVRWPGAIWLLGFGVALAWMLVARLVFVMFVPRRTLRDKGLLARVESIARRVGVFQRVRVGETHGLAGPIAFGILRPGISLPEGFARRFTREQQDAMLAHELAHLAARDPFWHALADVVSAMLWWHPLAWLAKRQLRAATEAAADDASLVVENGPNVLAECLVELGGRLTRTHSLGWLGMAGGDFRSGLGRRVKRLVSLSSQSWKPMRRSRVWLVRMAVPLALVALALAATVWAQPPFGAPSTLRQAFQRSVLGLALAAALPQAPTAPTATDHIDWQPWSRESLAAARAEGKTVLVHFTADWAVTAKANEQTSLEVPAVRAKLQEMGAIALRGDYTVADETIANELLAFSRAGVPLTLVYPSDSSLTPQKLPAVLTPQIVLDALEQGSAAPEKQASRIAIDSASSDRNKAPALILQGKALYEGGKLAEAESRLEQALKLDPQNPAAKHYLSLIQRPPPQRTTNWLSKPNDTRSALSDKLDWIRLKEVSFPGVSLNEVVEKLATMIKAADPDGKGINFIINHGINDSGRVDPSTGLPETDPLFATKVVIRLMPPLRDVTARQVIDAIVRTAETPIWYAVEDYAVVFSLTSPPPALHTRWFRIDANTFSRAMIESLTTNMDQAIKEAISAPPVLVDSPLPGKVRRFSVKPTGSELVEDARRLFTTAGVDFTVPSKSLVFSERRSQLMVRATQQDLDIIERAIQVMHTPPPQVTIEVKFAEITESDSKALGFDWFLRNTLTQNSGLRPQIRLATSAPGVPDPSGAAASTDNLLNLFQELRNHPLPALPSSIATNAPENEPLIGILTDSQYRVVLRALEQRQGVNILTPPKVTTLSGRQAQVKTVKVRYVVTDLDLSQIVSNATTGAFREVQPKPITELFELGPVLDVVPYVQADGHTIQMTVIPTFKEFLGYDMENARLVPPEAKSADMQQLTPLPIFRLRQIVSSVTVSDGQTVVLAGGSDRLLANPNKNQPLREGTKPPQEPKKTQLLVFVTATLIDPAGNRIHSPENSPRAVPPQESTPPLQ